MTMCTPYKLVQIVEQTYTAALQYRSEARTVDGGKKKTGCYLLDYGLSITTVASQAINVFLL
jgi:hypothetical protein